LQVIDIHISYIHTHAYLHNIHFYGILK